MASEQQKLEGTIKSLLNKKLKKQVKTLKVTTESLTKSHALFKEATIACERIPNYNINFKGTNRLQKAQYDEKKNSEKGKYFIQYHKWLNNYKV